MNERKNPLNKLLVPKYLTFAQKCQELYPKYGQSKARSQTDN